MYRFMQYDCMYICACPAGSACQCRNELSVKQVLRGGASARLEWCQQARQEASRGCAAADKVYRNGSCVLCVLCVLSGPAVRQAARGLAVGCGSHACRSPRAAVMRSPTRKGCAVLCADVHVVRPCADGVPSVLCLSACTTLGLPAMRAALAGMDVQEGVTKAAALPDLFGAPDLMAVCVRRVIANAVAALVRGRLPSWHRPVVVVPTT